MQVVKLSHRMVWYYLSSRLQNIMNLRAGPHVPVVCFYFLHRHIALLEIDVVFIELSMYLAQPVSSCSVR